MMTYLNKPIAIGRTAQLFARNDGLVLKLFNHGISRNTVEAEARLARIVHATGLPVPAVGEVVEVDDRFGLEYERINGITMLQAFMNQPWKFPQFARQLAELQAEMHRRSIPGLPSQSESYERKINNAQPLPDDVRQAALKKLASLPEDDKLCHGDFHPGNIMLTSHGPVIIDWIDASHGSPVIDVARSTLLMGGGPLPSGIPLKWLVRIIRGWFYKIYIRRYFQLNPEDLQQLATWVPLAAAARLDENIIADETRLLSIAQNLLRAG